MGDGRPPVGRRCGEGHGGPGVAAGGLDAGRTTRDDVRHHGIGGADAAPVPLALVAVTVKVYVSPLVSPGR